MISNAYALEWNPGDYETLDSLQALHERLIAQSEVAGMDRRAAREVCAEIVASWASGLVPHIRGSRAIVLVRALASITSDDLRSVWIRLNPGDLAMREALAQVDCLRKVAATTSNLPIVPLIGANRLPAELVEELVTGMKDGIDGRGVHIPTVLATLDAGELGLGVGASVVRRGPVFDTDMLRWPVTAGAAPFQNCISVNAMLLSIEAVAVDGDLSGDLRDLLEKTENKGLVGTISRYMAALDAVTSVVGIEPFARQSVIARFINVHNGTAGTTGADSAIREFLRPTQGPTASTAHAIGNYY